MTKEIIPKDCCVCDVCNLAVTDGSFIVTEQCFWYQGWLYCHNCNKKYSDGTSEMTLLGIFVKGDNISKTELAQPIVFEY